jgi:hypothetical protein
MRLAKRHGHPLKMMLSQSRCRATQDDAEVVEPSRYELRAPRESSIFDEHPHGHWPMTTNHTCTIAENSVLPLYVITPFLRLSRTFSEPSHRFYVQARLSDG